MSTFDYVLGMSDFSSGTVYFAGTASSFAIRKGGYSPRVAPDDEPTVEETLVARLTAGSAAGNLEELREVRRLLLQARRRQGNRTLPKVYVFFKQSASADQYRSEIVDGSAEFDASALDWEYWTQDTQYAEINWTRGNWWEGPEVQIPLTNLNGTANTSGLTVYNVNDLVGTAPTKRVNYVALAGTAIAGELDGLTRIEVKNTYSSNLLYHVWVGHNYTDPANLVWFYDANSATHTGGTATSAAASGGNYVTKDLVSGTETDMLTWSLSSAQLDAFAGRMYKAMMRFLLAFNTNVRYRLQLKWKNSAIWQSDLVSLAGAVYTTAIRELATMKTVACWSNRSPRSGSACHPASVPRSSSRSVPVRRRSCAASAPTSATTSSPMSSVVAGTSSTCWSCAPPRGWRPARTCRPGWRRSTASIRRARRGTGPSGSAAPTSTATRWI
jgi:hypothetical protein